MSAAPCPPAEGDVVLTPEQASIALSGVVDREATRLLEMVRERYPDAPEAAISGMMMAIVRFSIQRREAAGEHVTTRAVTGDLLPLQIKCANALLIKPAGKPS